MKKDNTRGAVIILTALLLISVWIALIFAEALTEGGSMVDEALYFTKGLNELHIPKWNA